MPTQAAARSGRKAGNADAAQVRDTAIQNMLNTHDTSAPAEPGTAALLAAAELQDDLMSASHDLDRLQTLLADACQALMARFHGAHAHLAELQSALPGPAFEPVAEHLASAVTALQFQDMASQLIAHTSRRLRSCADRIARDALGEDEAGATVIESAPQRPNPVTQDEMDAGSIELF